MSSNQVNKKFQRRDFVRNALYGALGLGAATSLKHMGLTQGFQGAFDFFKAQNAQSGSWNAFSVLQDALKGGPSLLGVSDAFAEGSKNVAFLDCFMGISSDCRHFLNLSSFGDANNIFKTLLSFGATQDALNGMIQDHPTYGAAKVNRWFGELVRTGKSEANPVINGFESRVKAIEPSRLCFTSFCSYRGTGNHQLGQLDRAGTLPYIIQKAFNLSPLGIAAFDETADVRDDQNKSIALGKPTGQFVADLTQFVSPSYFDRSVNQEQNVISQLDSLMDNSEAKELRYKWALGLEALQKEVGSWQPFVGLADKRFNPFNISNITNMGSSTDAGRCAAIALAGAMAKNGLGMVSSVAFPTHDFHADTVALAEIPGKHLYTMQHVYMETGTGLNIWANALIAAKKDGVAFIRIPSGRSANWVDDSVTTTSGLMIVVRGSDNSPLASMQNTYYGPSASGSFVEAATLDWASGLMGLGGGQILAAAVEGAVASVVAKAAGQTFSLDMQTQIGKIIL